MRHSSSSPKSVWSIKNYFSSRAKFFAFHAFFYNSDPTRQQSSMELLSQHGKIRPTQDTSDYLKKKEWCREQEWINIVTEVPLGFEASQCGNWEYTHTSTCTMELSSFGLIASILCFFHSVKPRALSRCREVEKKSPFSNTKKKAPLLIDPVITAMDL